MTAHAALESQSSFSPHGELRTAFYNPHEIKRRRRTSRSQFKTLEKAFCENPKPNASTRRHLAQSLSMTPRGIQVWFQNRRAKSKQASILPQDHIGADDTKNHDEVSRMDNSPLSQAQDGAPSRDICQESKEGASLKQQRSTSTAASSSLSFVVAAPIHTSLGRQTTDTAVPAVTDAVSSFSDGKHTSAHYTIMQLTWDPSQNWQNTPTIVSFSQTSPSIKSPTGHRKESALQSTPGTQDEYVEHLTMLQRNGPTDFSQPTSAKAPSDGQGSLAAAAAARRRRRSSVSKPAHIFASEISTIAESPSGNITTFHLASSTEECSKQEQGLKADTLLDRNTSMVLQGRSQPIMASNIGYNDASTWIHDYLNQQQPVGDSLIPPTLGLLNFSTGSSLSEAGVAGMMAEREESTPHQLQPTQVIDSATPSTETIEAPQANKTGRRRSSLKTGRPRPQSGTRVQFDVQPLTSLTQLRTETQEREEISSMKLWKPQTFNGLPKQEAAWDPWSPATHQEIDKSTLPVVAPESQLASSDSARSFFPCGALPELNQCLPDQAQSQALQDSQQLRRNSCPPEFIECFSRGLQIIPEALTLEENQQAFLHGLQTTSMPFECQLIQGEVEATWILDPSEG
ncbi:hypothetical protein BGZ67_009737 [Mortierella alpina]|nr:hypothetical protein BGZ67_009737 [Mortierella alpina]